MFLEFALTVMCFQKKRNWKYEKRAVNLPYSLKNLF